MTAAAEAADRRWASWSRPLPAASSAGARFVAQVLRGARYANRGSQPEVRQSSASPRPHLRLAHQQRWMNLRWLCSVPRQRRQDRQLPSLLQRLHRRLVQLQQRRGSRLQLLRQTCCPPRRQQPSAWRPQYPAEEPPRPSGSPACGETRGRRRCTPDPSRLVGLGLPSRLAS